MGRPKGSTNKKVSIKEEEQPKWTPKPDMGSIQPPPEKAKNCADCSHMKQFHYGQDRDWCNMRGCNCQEFK